MNKNIALLLTGLVLSTTLVSCFDKREDPEVIALREKLEAMEEAKAEAEAAEEIAELEAEKAKQEAKERAKEEEISDASAADKARLEKELAEIKSELNKQAIPAASKFGPGNGNNLEGASEGSLRIHTRSADGKLTLRSTAEQNGSKVVEIPNGTDNIYYFDRVKIGEYVWYEVDYFGKVGFLRGDYVHRY